MLFNSFQFLVFFVVVTSLFFTLPHRYRWLLLLVASCYFYMAFIPVYILILGGTIVVDYFAGILIERARLQGSRHTRFYLIASLVANIGVLAVFKYFNFFNENLTWLLEKLGQENHIPYLKIALPIGLSFHTFQAMSYTIEVYRGHQKAEKHFGIYALYVMFYPQLVAGPIERPQNILHQLYEEKNFEYNRVTDGMKLMVWGLFKKVVVADRLALFTDPVFNHPGAYSGTALCLAAIFFAYQIYCDFSGYSDIALGSARVMGFKLMTNFDKPYYARTISEFWKRWHISLSSWFRDYLYISLGGNRVALPRWYFNLFFVFLVSGFWHGANWTFIIWGAIHGFYLVFATLTQNWRNSFNRAIGLTRSPFLFHSLQIGTTFFLVTIAWIFFRANSLPDAMIYLERLPLIFTDLKNLVMSQRLSLGVSEVTSVGLFLSIFFIIVLEAVQLMQKRFNLHVLIGRQPGPVRWGIYYLAILVIVFFGVFENRQFIYFQF